MMPTAEPVRDRVDARAFPRVAAYLDSLPEGLASYPGFKSKASIYLALVAELGVPLRTAGFPAKLAGLIDSPPTGNTWVPTVHVNAIELLIADHLASSEAFVQLAYQMNRKLLGSAMYRPLVFVSSPAFLLKVSAMVWGRFHSGTVLRPRIEHNSARLDLSFPERLLPRLLLEDKATAYRAAAEAAGGREVTAVVEECSADRARFALAWS